MKRDPAALSEGVVPQPQSAAEGPLRRGVRSLWCRRGSWSPDCMRQWSTSWVSVVPIAFGAEIQDMAVDMRVEVLHKQQAEQRANCAPQQASGLHVAANVRGRTPPDPAASKTQASQPLRAASGSAKPSTQAPWSSSSTSQMAPDGSSARIAFSNPCRGARGGGYLDATQSASMAAMIDFATLFRMPPRRSQMSSAVASRRR